MTVILLNCVTLGMFQPCEDTTCDTQRCKLLKVSSNSEQTKVWTSNSEKDGKTNCQCNSDEVFVSFLQICDHMIYAYFALELCIKIIAMGVFGKGCYLSETWNRLDFFIVFAG